MSPSPPPLVELFSKPDCHLCDEAKLVLRELQASHSFTLRIINITAQEALVAQYGEEIPVIYINGRKAFKYRVEPHQFVRRLRRTQGRTGRRPWHRIWQR